jgi:K(+)-stimulated pyrophosphate-energized sodium pump
MDLAVIAPMVGLLTMIIVFFISKNVLKEKEGTKRMKEIASYIQEGANAFLKREVKTILIFIIIISALLFIFLSYEIGIGFILGSLFSLFAAFIGMWIAVRTNVRTANAARRSAKKAMEIAFRGASVTGLSIVGMSLLGLGILYFSFGKQPILLVGFGFGASLAALFAQLGGGIYTKAADVGADLVGKVEKKIPEDDPRNPAVIADQVGDNVGDCAGRGADLFESFSDNIIGAMIVGLAFVGFYGINAVIFPFIIESIGVIATIVGILSVRGGKNPISSLYKGLFITGVLCIIGFYFASTLLLQNIRLFFCASLGLFASLVVALIVIYYTSSGRKVTREIAKASQSGPAINLMTGFSYGLESAVPPVLVIAFVTLLSYLIAGGGIEGIYGIAVATLGILSTTGIIMACDTFGPISDNAQGIVEMSGIKGRAVKATEMLDEVGNVTKAITKGYAMACCILSSITLLFAYLFDISERLGFELTFENITINLANPVVIIAGFIGASLPFLFSGLAIRAVSKTAFQMVEEVRRQFREIKGLLQGKAKADYSKCIDISTKNSLREMILPTLISLITPVLVGFILGVWALASYLISVTIVSALLAVFMYNSGGAWDNAKKFIEEGNFGGKGTKTHAAAVIGDTFGDPLKDTAGPSLHILVKLQNIVAITLLPLFLSFSLL